MYAQFDKDKHTENDMPFGATGRMGSLYFDDIGVFRVNTDFEDKPVSKSYLSLRKGEPRQVIVSDYVVRFDPITGVVIIAPPTVAEHITVTVRFARDIHPVTLEPLDTE
jgi:hypothetical protein